MKRWTSPESPAQRAAREELEQLERNVIALELSILRRMEAPGLVADMARQEAREWTEQAVWARARKAQRQALEAAQSVSSSSDVGGRVTRVRAAQAEEGEEEEEEEEIVDSVESLRRHFERRRLH